MRWEGWHFLAGDRRLRFAPRTVSGTERPWHVDGVFIVNDGDLIVTTMTHEARSNADRELIVRAVNAFDDLVSALREARKQIDDTLCVRDDHHDACVAADAALALAGVNSA